MVVENQLQLNKVLKFKDKFKAIVQYEGTPTEKGVLSVRDAYKYNLKRLKRREECDTYLTHVCGHHCRGEKIKYKIELSANIVAFTSTANESLSVG